MFVVFLLFYYLTTMIEGYLLFSVCVFLHFYNISRDGMMFPQCYLAYSVLRLQMLVQHAWLNMHTLPIMHDRWRDLVRHTLARTHFLVDIAAAIEQP